MALSGKEKLYVSSGSSKVTVTAQAVADLAGDGTIPAATTSTIGGVKQAAAQADSEATDAAGLVEDYNALLAALRTAGILASA